MDRTGSDISTLVTTPASVLRDMTQAAEEPERGGDGREGCTAEEAQRLAAMLLTSSAVRNPPAARLRPD